MSVTKRLQSLKLMPDAMITLTYEEGADVFHFNETEIETALAETSVINELASLITQPKLDVRNQWAGNIVNYLREEQYLDDYERGSETFEEYIVETLSESIYDLDLIETETKKYDHKRGFTTLTATVEIPAYNFFEVEPMISGWTVSVETDVGTVTFDA